MIETQSLRALTRRQLLTRAAAAGTSFVIGAGFVAGRDAAWATEMDALKPETMATLIQMARDIYPHDKVGDAYYAAAVKSYDTPDEADFVQAGVDALNDKASEMGFGTYLGAGWEADRVAILRAVEETEFFQRIRGGLVTGLYNQKEVWPIFGYEGESYTHGGYLYRGFDDIAWI